MAEAAAAKKTAANPIVIDLGKQKKNRVSKLSKGKGPLMDDVGQAIEELRQQGVLGASAQPVIVVVRQKRKKNRRFF
ncbi:MAG: hypothetical protein KC620_02530 [Myxococcales bacterium]|nr:hypothetical protein [Myxococcales bacterium]